jgi:hypothetical protein
VRERSRAAIGFTPRAGDGSTPTIDGNYSVTGTTQSVCLKLDEFHLLLVDLPRRHRWKDFNSSFILKHTDRCTWELVAI